MRRRRRGVVNVLGDVAIVALFCLGLVIKFCFTVVDRLKGARDEASAPRKD